MANIADNSHNKQNMTIYIPHTLNMMKINQYA